MVTLRLILAHMIGDYVLQTGEIARNKAEGWRGLLLHVTIVTLVSGVLVMGMFPYWWAWVIVLGVLHLLIDQYRTFRVRNLKPQLYLPYLIFDQVVHLATILTVAYAGARETPADLWRVLRQPLDLTVSWPIPVIMAIFLIWTAAVLEMEAVRAFSQRCKIPPPHSILLPDRLFGAAERLVAVALLLSPLPAFYLIAFLPRLLWHLRYRSGQGNFWNCGVRTTVSMLAATGVGLFFLWLR
ncbi:MAG: DUF3307 domain-containing protein [Anaerolineae bacterium]|nr:DUF3307 domain-containing protein [Anaerolineae bacterium]MDW8098643.1 DUF3307 domain-containing protein [Anaerolineae bacterium]